PAALEWQPGQRVWPATGVDRGRCEPFAHGHAGIAESPDPRAVAEGLRERGAESQRHVFDGVVLVDLEVTFGPDHEVEQGVVSEAAQEVVVEADARVHVRFATAVEPNLHPDVRLARTARDTRPPRGRRPGRVAVAVGPFSSSNRASTAAACAGR